MLSDEQKRQALATFLYTSKRAIEDALHRQISDRQFADMIGLTPASLSKYLNAAVMAGPDKIDRIANRLDKEFARLEIPLNAMDIYAQLELPPRVSTQDMRLIEIVHLWNRLTDEQRAALHSEFMERVGEVA